MLKTKTVSILSHLLVWVVLFMMPYLLSYSQEQDITRVFMHFWVPIVFFVIIFYSNYFQFIDRFLFTNKTLVFIGINLLMIVFFLFLKEYIETTFFAELNNQRGSSDTGNRPPIKLIIYVHMLSYLAPLLFSIALKMTKRWATTEAERKEAANVKLQSELQHLHYQLQPHFFFNSLNNIYSLVDISPEQAKSSIHSLSKLMRYMLYETNLEQILLSKEIDFMTKYIELMKLRVSDKTKVTYQFPTQETGIKIAPLLFISLIENSFKHGVSATQESNIKVSMTTNDKEVCFTIENNDFPKKTTDKSGSGIGLQNLEKRLKLLYQNAYSFKTTKENNSFKVELNIDTH